MSTPQYENLFGTDIYNFDTDHKYTFTGNVEAGLQYIIRISRYGESLETSRLYMDYISADNKIDVYSKMVQKSNPFIVDRYFTAKKTGKVIYTMEFSSSILFKQNYPTFEAFKLAFTSGKITINGESVLDDASIMKEYEIELNLPNNVHASVLLLPA
jgi:hypothetical protein